ncbi:MAG: SMC-Scp complex subunit ScpB [Christensenellales bacterium]
MEPTRAAPESSDERELAAAVEAVLFVAGDPVALGDLARVLQVPAEQLEQVVEGMRSQWKFQRRGLELMRFGDQLQIRTRPDLADVISQTLNPVQKQSLSQSALETLSVVAYRQPVTKQDIEAVRGVKCDYAVSVLVDRGLIHEVGRKDALGRPILYGTTEAFLQHFGIENLAQLPGQEILNQADEAPPALVDT